MAARCCIRRSRVPWLLLGAAVVVSFCGLGGAEAHDQGAGDRAGSRTIVTRGMRSPALALLTRVFGALVT